MSLFKPNRRLVIFDETSTGSVDMFLASPEVRRIMEVWGVTPVEKWVTDERVERIEEDYGYEMMGDDL